MSLDQYEFIDVPGMGDIRIPIIKRMSEHEEDSAGVRSPEWVVHFKKLSINDPLPAIVPDSTELFGFYCESSRYVKGDASLYLYTSGTLLHSEVFLVTQNGSHSSRINQALASGKIYNSVQILRTSRINGEIKAIQSLTFSGCHWCGIQSYLDWTISQFTACKRENAMRAFTQEGLPEGTASCVTSYTANTSSADWEE